MEYKIGDIVSGKVTGIEKYGFFILIENETTGLVHISEITDSFVHNIKDYVDINEIIRARVIGYDEEDPAKLKLSIKDMQYSDRFFLEFPIHETESKFKNLQSSLTGWIQEKEKEMEEEESCQKNN